MTLAAPQCATYGLGVSDGLDLRDELFRITDALSAAGIEYALCGGIAVIVHGYPRMTQDIDMLVDPRELDNARTAVTNIGYTLESDRIPFDVGKSTERIIFRFTKVVGQDYLSIDFILVNDFLADVWRDRQHLQLDNRDLRVVSREGLAKMKRAAGRSKDLADLEQLGIDPNQT